MTYDLADEEYLAAVGEACRLVDAAHSTPRTLLSAQDAAIKRFIAATYDTAVPCDILNTLMRSDSQRQNVLLTLLVGRCKYGRPQHERADDMLAWGIECLTDGRPAGDSGGKASGG